MAEREVQPQFKTFTPKKPRKGLNKVGRKARREREALDEFRALVKERAEGLCQAQVLGICQIRGSQAHHRAPSDRDKGIHDPERGLYVCLPCHGFIHGNPNESYSKGWLIKETMA